MECFCLCGLRCCGSQLPYSTQQTKKGFLIFNYIFLKTFLWQINRIRFCSYVLVRRLSKQPFVLSDELRTRFVADGICGRSYILSLGEQKMPRLVKPDSFLILKRRESGDRFEKPVEGRNGHIGHTCDIFYANSFCKVMLDP